jgi:hypothetical protein
VWHRSPYLGEGTLQFLAGRDVRWLLALLALHVMAGNSRILFVLSQRAKGAGMRWSAPGAQSIANLRALHHSAHPRWDTFWAGKPLTRLRLLPPPWPWSRRSPPADRQLSSRSDWQTSTWLFRAPDCRRSRKRCGRPDT